MNELLESGMTYAQIGAATGLSVPAIGRYAISRKSALAKLVDGEPSFTTVVGRLIEAADDARELRRQSRVTGSPVGRSRAIAAESALLLKLIDTLGIDDTSVQDLIRDVEVLLPIVATFAASHPDQARPLIDRLDAEDRTHDLATALRSQMEQKR